MEVLRNMQLFVEVARASSFRRAADVLGLPVSTVSRRIAELERDVGLKLLTRTTRRVELTEGGRNYFENCKRIVQEAELARLELANLQANPSGVIRASLPVDFSVMYLSPLLAEFASLYPDICFDLDLTPTQVSMVTDAVDIAIRMGAPRDPNVISRRLARLSAGLYASPAYLSSRGLPRQPKDLLQHECLRMRDAPWVLSRAKGVAQTLAIKGRFVANNVGLLRSMAVAGGGIMLIADQMAQADCAEQRLVRVLPGWSPPDIEVHAMTSTRLLPAKVRLFVEFLVAKMGGVEPRPLRTTHNPRKPRK